MLPFAALIRRFERQHLVWACHQDRYYSKFLGTSVIIAGIKTATVEVIASATLAAFIGAGGLGFIVLGFALYDNAILLVGAIPALLALIAEVSLSTLQRTVQPPAR